MSNKRALRLLSAVLLAFALLLIGLFFITGCSSSSSKVDPNREQIVRALVRERHGDNGKIYIDDKAKAVAFEHFEVMLEDMEDYMFLTAIKQGWEVIIADTSETSRMVNEYYEDYTFTIFDPEKALLVFRNGVKLMDFTEDDTTLK